MLMKASYILLSTASLGLLLFEAPRGALLTSAPERGKVEHKEGASTGSGNATVRRRHYIFLGGYHGGK